MQTEALNDTDPTIPRAKLMARLADFERLWRQWQREAASPPAERNPDLSYDEIANLQVVLWRFATQHPDDPATEHLNPCSLDDQPPSS